MKYSLNFGRVTSPSPRAKKPGDAFRIAVLGDFSGRANIGKLETGAALGARLAHPIDVDNFEAVFRNMGLKLHLPLAADGGAVEIDLASIDDFHPDQLYSSLPFFSELAGLRRRLKNNSTFDAAAQEMQSWPGLSVQRDVPRAKARGAAVPLGKLSDFARLIGRPTATEARETSVDELISRIVAPHVVSAPHPDQEAMIAAVDEAISAAMRQIVHHPDFQALESLWRSIELLTRELETGPQLQIILYDITAEEIAADLSAADGLEATGLYRLLVANPAIDQRMGPLSVLVGNYMFDLIPPHAELLGRIGRVAAAAQAPFIAAISTDCLARREPGDVHPLIVESWDALRQTPQASYLGLTVPRFMLRWPYGKKTEPIDSFDFEEFTPQVGLGSMLWGNGAILAGLLLGKTFSDQGLKAMELGSVMSISDMPFFYYTDSDGDQVALPNTERAVSESTAVHVASQNFMPVLCIRGRPEVRLGSFTSLAGHPLAGPWAPVEIAPDEGPPPDATDDVPDADEELSVEEIEAKAAAEAEQELDALLAGVSSTAEPEPEPTSPDDDLDALLSAIAANDEQPPPAAEGGMDPELAAMLADL